MILVVGYYFISKDNTPKRLKKMRREQSEVAKLKWKITVTFIGIIAIIVILFLACANWRKQVAWQEQIPWPFTIGDYIDPALIKKFEKETGYKVNYETFDSNEAMYTKIQQGGTAYDIAIPSEYMIQKWWKRRCFYHLITAN